jgi:hypothetical protein
MRAWFALPDWIGDNEAPSIAYLQKDIGVRAIIGKTSQVQTHPISPYGPMPLSPSLMTDTDPLSSMA